NSPSTNLFPSMVVDENGNLWCASGRDVVNKGFYKFDGQSWTNFLLKDYPIMGGNAYHKVNLTSNNTIWMNSWGYGFLKVKEGEIQKRFHSGNTPLVGIKDNKDFIVAAGVAEDSKKNLWFAVHDPGNKNLLAKLSNDSVWTLYKNEADTNTILTDDFVIDKYDTKWLTFRITLSNSQEGVYYFNETGTISSRKGFLTTTQGLNGTPTCIVVDLQGEIWIGTNLGVNIITNPTNPSKGITSVYALRNQYVNCIKVDGLNNKWVGTQKGVWVLSPDGSQVLVQYNTSNSPILSDDIKSIAIDDNKGLVFFGTELGLSSLWTTSVKPFENFNELSIYPNPFYLDRTEKKLTIDGLVGNSLIKIISVDGDLIRDFVTPGGRIAFWDGKNNEGNFVSSGVYFIIAYTEDGEKVATSKVAVINK
ncbi:MAG: hypothetical protein N3A61_07575, partial [Ignavibacteria bacterium]|nr:hypothetical protein [Ignavibacteria bacterium]